MFSSPLGLVLAGGLARRMGGGDKARIRIGGKTILERVLARLAPQCGAMILNANGDPARFGDTGLPVVPDTVPGFAGPLAGILAGLDWAAAQRAGGDRRRERARRLSVSPTRPRSPPRAGAQGGRTAAGLRTLRRLAASGDRPLAGRPAGRSAHARWSRTTCARSRPGPPAMASPSPTGLPTLRSLLQRQHARGRRRGPAHRVAAMRPLSA